jgi:hypothetical protein
LPDAGSQAPPRGGPDTSRPLQQGLHCERHRVALLLSGKVRLRRVADERDLAVVRRDPRAVAGGDSLDGVAVVPGERRIRRRPGSRSDRAPEGAHHRVDRPGRNPRGDNVRPPGRSTRRMSPIASSADGAKMAANTDRTTSNDSVGKRKRLRLADDHRCVEALARQTRPCHLHESHRRSTAVTTAPRRAAASDAFPVPQPTSSVRSPGRTEASSTTCRAAGSSAAAVAS